jgi:hypothetical protein
MNWKLLELSKTMCDLAKKIKVAHYKVIDNYSLYYVNFKKKQNENPLVISKKYAQEMRLKMSAFNYFTKNQKTLFCTFITAGGVVQNTEATLLIQSKIRLEDLF